MKKKQNKTDLQDFIKAVLRYIALYHYIKKKRRLQINNLSLYTTRKRTKKNKLKVSRRREITKINSEICEIETRQTMEKINKTKSLYSERKQNRQTFSQID